MAEKEKFDLKKFLLILAPIVAGVCIYFLFLHNPSKDSSPEGIKLVLPDATDEELLGSKSEIYKREQERKLAEEREKEGSYINSKIFYRMGTNPPKEEEEEALSIAEGYKQLYDLLPDDNDDAPISQKKKSKWEVKEVEDPLSKFDYVGSGNYSSVMAVNNTPKTEQTSAPTTAKPTQKKTTQKQSKPKAKPATPEPPPVDPRKPGQRSRNNSMETDNLMDDGNLIPAAVHNDQVITNGSTVKLRLLKDIYVDGQKIPKNTFVYGIARFSSERVAITLESIRLSNVIIPFSKTVIDKDGLEGLYFPDNMANQMGTEMGGSAIDEIYERALSGTSTAGTIINTTKSILKRRNVEKKVTLKANYNIYLK